MLQINNDYDIVEADLVCYILFIVIKSFRLSCKILIILWINILFFIFFMQLFFPICAQDHWFLLCVNSLQKEINFFSSSSIPCAKDTNCFISNLVNSFFINYLVELLLIFYVLTVSHKNFCTNKFSGYKFPNKLQRM